VVWRAASIAVSSSHMQRAEHSSSSWQVYSLLVLLLFVVAPESAKLLLPALHRHQNSCASMLPLAPHSVCLCPTCKQRNQARLLPIVLVPLSAVFCASGTDGGIFDASKGTVKQPSSKTSLFSCERSCFLLNDLFTLIMIFDFYLLHSWWMDLIARAGNVLKLRTVSACRAKTSVHSAYLAGRKFGSEVKRK